MGSCLTLRNKLSIVLQWILEKKKRKKAKWLPGEALQIAVKRREVKSKGEKKRYIRTGHGTTDWFQIGKGVRQGCILSPCLFNFYSEYIMRNAGLEEAQAGIKIAGRNNNLRYADDTTLMAESEEELKSLLMKVKGESEKLA